MPQAIVICMLSHTDMLTLLRCRLQCRLYRELVNSELRIGMRRILRHYIPEPTDLLDALLAYRAVISGRAALALFLRDDTILDRDLEVSVCHEYQEELNSFVSRCLPVVKVLGLDRREGQCQMTEEGRPTRSTTIYKVKGRRRRYIRVVGSSYSVALGAVNWLKNTALLCFFSPWLIGCAYPYLTLRRMGLHRADPWPPMVGGRITANHAEMTQNISLVVNHGFRLSHDPRTFIEPPVLPYIPEWPLSPCPRCVRHLYLCACNLRYWGDRGCLMAVLEPSERWTDILVYSEPLEGGLFNPWRWPGLWNRCHRVYYLHEEDQPEAHMADMDCLVGQREVNRVTLHIAPTFPTQ